MAKTMLSLPDTSMKDYIEAEQAAERLRDGYAEYFKKYDALITPVLPIPAHKHGVHGVRDQRSEGRMPLTSRARPCRSTLPACPACRCGSAPARKGCQSDVQLVGSWLAESTILHLASLLETGSPVLQPSPEHLRGAVNRLRAVTQPQPVAAGVRTNSNQRVVSSSLLQTRNRKVCMSTETSKLKPKADAIAQFRYGAEAQAIGVVEANGMVSLHGHDATHREKRLPLIASDRRFKSGEVASVFLRSQSGATNQFIRRSLPKTGLLLRGQS